jgi:protein gp37
MSQKSKIEWTDSTWNPIVGCSIVSPGCTNCYAMRDAWRKNHNPLTPQYHGLTKMVNGNPVWTGQIRPVEHKFSEPTKRRKPTMYFVNSMGDLFHEDAAAEWINRCFDVMEDADRHTFQVLTKRSALMRAYVERLYSLRTPPSHIWLGISAEDQKRYDERAPDLAAIKAAGCVTFISAEPLIAAIDMKGFAPHWLIAGSESGPGAKPCNVDWVRSLRDQCVANGTAFFFKQFVENGRKLSTPELDGKQWREFPVVERAA